MSPGLPSREKSHCDTPAAIATPTNLRPPRPILPHRPAADLESAIGYPEWQSRVTCHLLLVTFLQSPPASAPENSRPSPSPRNPARSSPSSTPAPFSVRASPISPNFPLGYRSALAT